jgi:hypothetical protein
VEGDDPGYPAFQTGRAGVICSRLFRCKSFDSSPQKQRDHAARTKSIDLRQYRQQFQAYEKIWEKSSSRQEQGTGKANLTTWDIVSPY